MNVTIKDVAKRANVAPSTVSRVISDSPKISDATKRKVQKVMDEMGYHINLNARDLVQKSSKTIGIVMKNSTEEMLHTSFMADVIRGISDLARKRGFSISLITGDTEEVIFQDAVEKVRGKRVDGMIVLYSKEGDKVVPFLLESGLPFAMIGRPVTDSDRIMYVDNDNIQAAKDATTYLIERGHERIAFIGDDPDYEVAQARMEGYNQAIAANQLKVFDGYERFIKFDPEQGKKAITELMSLPVTPSAIVVTDDFNALIVVSAINEIGYSIPNDVSVISFNNSVIARLANPPLTSVDTQIYQLGYESTRCVLDEINEPSEVKRSVIIPTVITERESCKSYSESSPKTV